MHPLAFDPVDGTPIKGITKIPDWARVPEGWVDSPEEAAKPVPPRDYKWLKGKVAVVTGGGGFVGRNIGLDLLSIAKCKTVKLVDLREPQAWNGRDEEAKKATKAGRLQFVKVDLTSQEDVTEALKGADAVFHVASYGMSGPEMLHHDRIWIVNLGGTKNVVRGCLRNSVPVLVYTSSYNVCFGGQSIEGADEAMPYFPIAGHTEEYSKSKAAAEQFVLEVGNMEEFIPPEDTPIREGVGTRLRCCAVRAAAIYGEGEERHFPRILRMLKSGLICFTYGGPSHRVDWVHVNNLSQCQLLAAERMGQELEWELAGKPQEAYPYRRVAGRKYFASDGDPQNQFELLKPFFELYGYDAPPSWACIPLPPMLLLGRICEIYFELTAGKLGGPFLTRAEVLKSGQNHWFKIDRAEKDLGYKSLIDSKKGMENLAKWYHERDPDAQRERSFFERYSGLLSIALAVIVLLVVLGLVLSVYGISLLGIWHWTLKKTILYVGLALIYVYKTLSSAWTVASGAVKSTSLYQWWSGIPEQLRWVIMLLPMPFVTWHMAKENALRANETYELMKEIERRNAEEEQKKGEGKKDQ